MVTRRHRERRATHASGGRAERTNEQSEAERVSERREAAGVCRSRVSKQAAERSGNERTNERAS